MPAWRVGSPNESFDNAFYFEDLRPCEAERGELSHVYRVQVKASTDVGIPGGTFVEYQDGPPGRRMQILIGSRGNDTVFLFRDGQSCPGSPPVCPGFEVTRAGLGYHTIEWIYAGDAADVFIGGELAIRGYTGWPVAPGVASLATWGNSQPRTPGEGRFSYVRWYTPPADDCGTCQPIIRAQPLPVSVLPGQTVRLAVDAANGPLDFQWRRNGVPVSNGPGGAAPGGGTVEGADHPTLSVRGATCLDAGQYDAIVTSACGSVTTNPAAVVVGLCPADFNCDGFVDFFDFDDYVSCFEGLACPPGATADFNNDGFTDFFDFDGFVSAFETGCP